MEIMSPRPLEAIEKLYWTIEQKGRIHFALAAEIEGSAPLSNWKAALRAVQIRHPNLNAGINGETTEELHFVYQNNRPIPVRIVKLEGNESWEPELQYEMDQPFDLTEAPLVRVVIVEKHYKSILIFVSHHTIGDGLSVVYLISELINELDDISESTNLIQNHIPTTASVIPAKRHIEDKVLSTMSITSLTLSEELTSLLQTTAKERGTTVHGALTAAALTALNLLSPEWLLQPVAVFHPVSIRDYINTGKDYRLSSGMTIKNYNTKTEIPFWELARGVKKSIADVKSADLIEQDLKNLDGLFGQGLSTDALFDIIYDITRHTVLISNLGKIPYGSQFGSYILTGVWGPAVLPDHVNAQSIGVATFAGKLSMVLTSRNPVKALLDKMKDVLSQALT